MFIVQRKYCQQRGLTTTSSKRQDELVALEYAAIKLSDKSGYPDMQTLVMYLYFLNWLLFT